MSIVHEVRIVCDRCERDETFDAAHTALAARKYLREEKGWITGRRSTKREPSKYGVSVDICPHCKDSPP